MSEGKVIRRMGWFFEGKAMNWDVEDTGEGELAMEITKDGRVLVGGVEIVPWTQARKRSLNKREWVSVGGR